MIRCHRTPFGGLGMLLKLLAAAVLLFLHIVAQAEASEPVSEALARASNHCLPAWGYSSDSCLPIRLNA
jgi:hypothetical protein